MEPQMLVVSDLDDIFLPLPDDLLVNLVESRTVVETLLEKLGQMFRNTNIVSSALGPAMNAANSLIVCSLYSMVQNSFFCLVQCWRENSCAFSDASEYW